MDLRTWVATDHASLRSRFEGSIGGVVAPDRWKAHADGGGSTIAWLRFHGAFHEDLALTTAVRKHPPLLDAHRDALGISRLSPWRGLSEAEDHEIVAALELDALEEYATAIHDATEGWIATMSSMALDSIPDSSRRLERLARIPVEEVPWLHRMWDGKPVWWFLQWQCVGHQHGHLGEMISVRNRMGLSPF